MLEMVEAESARCYVLVHSSKREFYKKFVYEPLPVESHLNHFLSNHLNAEIVAKNIHNT
jgi:pre-mRNA-splicing helicase BRR2